MRSSTDLNHSPSQLVDARVGELYFFMEEILEFKDPIQLVADSMDNVNILAGYTDQFDAIVEAADLAVLVPGYVTAAEAARDAALVSQTAAELAASNAQGVFDTSIVPVNASIASLDSRIITLENFAENSSAIKTLYESNPNTNEFTDAEKTKLAGLDDSRFKGTYVSLTALQTAHPSPDVGSNAYVDVGVGNPIVEYIWDNDDSNWVEQSGSGGTAETPASVKSKYESNADTNALTDALLTKLNNIDANATDDQTAAEIESLLDTYFGSTDWKTGGGSMTDAEVKIAYENNADTNALTNALLTKLNGIETGATNDQTGPEIESILDTHFGDTDWRTGGGSSTSPYDIRLGFSTTPTSDQIIDTIAFPREVTIPADCAGSVGVIATNPTAGYTLEIRDDNSAIATVTISTTGTFTFTTTGNTAQTIAAGSIVTFVAPTTVDATAANMVMTLLGSA